MLKFTYQIIMLSRVYKGRNTNAMVTKCES